MMSVEVRVRRADRPEFAPWAPKPRYVHYDPIPKSICDLHLCANYNNRENGYCFRAPSAPPHVHLVHQHQHHIYGIHYQSQFGNIPCHL